MDDKPAVGWSRDPEGPDRYRYWNGREWTAHARAPDRGDHGMAVAFDSSYGGWHHIWYRKFLRNTVVFHTLAWLNCSVPITKGHLRRFMQPREQRTIDQIRTLRDGV